MKTQNPVVVKPNKEKFYQKLWHHLKIAGKIVFYFTVFFAIVKFLSIFLMVVVFTKPGEDQFVLALCVTPFLFYTYFYRYNSLKRFATFLRDSGRIFCDCIGIFLVVFAMIVFSFIIINQFRTHYNNLNFG